MDNILLIGSGAREHALLRAIKRSCQQNTVTCLGGFKNPGILKEADTLVVGPYQDERLLKSIVREHAINMAIIGPEAPLEVGISDLLIECGVQVVGPTKRLAQIETSKPFCRQLISPTLNHLLPKFSVIDDCSNITTELSRFNGDVVVKATGLMGGKGVYVSGDHFDTDSEAIAIALDCFKKHDSVLFEEKLFGEEFSLISVCDGKTLKHFPLVKDNKRAYVDDKGPNTGGMGSVSFNDHSLPLLPKEILQEAQKANEQVVSMLQNETGETYRGIIYGGYMMTKCGLKIIEFNARFGDPECINLLYLLQTDFLELCHAICHQTLDELSLSFAHQFSVCKYAVPSGYPIKSRKDSIINFPLDDPHYYCGHIQSVASGYEMLGSRAVACLGVGASLSEAQVDAENKISDISGDFFYREDIGQNAWLEKHKRQWQVLVDEH